DKAAFAIEMKLQEIFEEEALRDVHLQRTPLVSLEQLEARPTEDGHLARNVFRKRGEKWEIVYRGCEPRYFDDDRGFLYLHRLLTRKGKEVRADEVEKGEQLLKRPDLDRETTGDAKGNIRRLKKEVGKFQNRVQMAIARALDKILKAGLK